MQWPLMTAEAGAEGGNGGGGAATADAGQGAGTQDASLLNGAGNATMLDWRASLPENLRTASIIQRHTTMEAAAKSLVAQDQMLGRALFLPEETADDATKLSAMQKVYDKLGRPETADKYTLPVPKGRALDAEIQGRWQKAFHAAGLSQSQVTDVMAEYWRTVQHAEQLRAGMEAQSFAEGRKTLYAEFGASTDEVVTAARGFAEHFGAGAFGGKAGELLWGQLMEATLPDGSKLANSPYLMTVFSEAAKAIGEGNWYDSPHYTPGSQTVETLQARSRELTTKRHNGSITADESAELQKIFRDLARHQERTGPRVA